MSETLCLVDGHSQINRAYWSPMQDLTAPDGEPVKATYLFTQMMIKLIQHRKPDYIAVALDPPGGPKRRKALYPEYKADRDMMPEDLVPQIKRIRQLLDTAGIPTLLCDGEEADDIIATVVERLKDRPIHISIISRDKDLYQLLTERVSLCDPQKDVVIDPGWLAANKGFTPAESAAIQTLAGDNVDNIPGVPGVGIKKATALIKKYGSAEAVLENADALTPKLRENIIAFRSELAVTKQLVTLKRDCPVSMDLEAWRTDRLNLQGLAPAFKALNFTRLIPMVSPPGASKAAAPTQPDLDTLLAETAEEKLDSADAYAFQTVLTPEALNGLAASLRQAGRFAVDTETTSLNIHEADLVGISFAWNGGEGCYVPMRSNRGPTVSHDLVQDVLGPILADPALAKIGQNIKYDMQILRRAGLPLQGVHFDTMVASYLLDALRQSHGMDALARDFLRYRTIPLSDIMGKGKDAIAMTDADPERLAVYAGEDALVTWRLWEKMAPALVEAGLNSLFEEIEMPLVSVLAEMEWQGVKLDTQLLASISEEFGRKLSDLESRIWESAGREFKISSPKQLAAILFDELGLPVIKKTKTSRSTNAEVLRTLDAGHDHPLPGLVLQYRELAKLKNTYIDVLPGMVSAATGCLHPHYHQAVTATGRLSSSDPNIQNIPIRTEEGRRIRQAFVPRESRTILMAADYSQIELRLLAHLSRDPGLCEAFQADEDIHNWVASKIWGLPPTEIPAQLRSQAKAVNFGIIYGQTAFGLSQALGIPRGEAARFIQEYKAKFVKINDFVADTIEATRRTGAVKTMLGRQRRIPDILSRNRMKKQQAERFAVNTLIQGSAADLIKAAMVQIHRMIQAETLPARLIIQVHDELVFEVPEDRAAQCETMVRDAMENAMPLSVPLKVDVATGKSWPK